MFLFQWLDWLGRQDSNLGMAESKSAALPLGYAPKERRTILAETGEINRRDAGRGGEFVEMHVAIRLRPQADLPGDRFRQRVLQIELAVEIALDLVARNADFEVMPLPGCGRGVSDPFDRRPPALLELPKD